ncbi:MAG: hypothetical protein K8T26_13975 [Lentisphaerae bacterium]|nr:hypothetical protein [Lentisphaerota bacterium]
MRHRDHNIEAAGGRDPRTGLAILLVAGLLVGRAALAGNAIPLAESFEPYPVGEDVGALPGWSSTVGASFMSTNATALGALAAYTNAGGALPLSTSHAQVLALDGSVSLAVVAPTGRLVRTDMLLLPWRIDDLPATDAGLQLSLCFNSNGQAVVFHHDPVAGTNAWRELAQSPQVPTLAWVRVTFLQDYSNHMFQVSLNGTPVTDDQGWSEPGASRQPGGSWFFMPATNGTMSQVEFRDDGHGFVDDLEIVGDLATVATVAASNVTPTTAELPGMLSDTGLAQTAVMVYWGPADGGTLAGAWANTNTWDAPQAPGDFVFTANVATNTVVYYRYAAENAYGQAWADRTEWAVVDPITLTVPRKTDAPLERPVGTGIFRLVRPAGTAGVGLTVRYVMSGSASNGVDYVTLPGSIVMPPGATNVDVVLTTIPDGITEGDEEAVLTLLPGNFVAGAAVLGDVTILDVGAAALVWDNSSGDRRWNSSSTNWLGADGLFFPADHVTFKDFADATGRVYVGSAPSMPADVRPGAMTVLGGLYEFAGGAVLGVPVTIQGGRVIDRELGRSTFGSGAITLSGGGEFWRQVEPDTTTRLQLFSNDLVVAGTATVQGGLGTNAWLGDVTLKARLYVGGTNPAVGHVNQFLGTLTVNQDTNSTAGRVVSLRAGGGAAYLSGPIVDDPDTNHGGNFPLWLETQADSGLLTLTSTGNTYACGTVVTSAGGTNGVVVAAGSSLGRGRVTVAGDGARLLVQGPGAMAAPLLVGSNATVILAASGAVTGIGNTVTVTNGGLLVLQSDNGLPDDGTLALAASGRVQVGSNLVETVRVLYLDGQSQLGGVYTAVNRPAYIWGHGAIRVKGPMSTGALILVR